MSMLKDILAISGYGGLYRFISQGKNGIIVESLETGKRRNIPATTKISALEDIAIYTDTEEVALGEVMKKIYQNQNGQPAIHHKSQNEELKSFFQEVLPDYDEDRVYVSDIKKVIRWYNLLLDLNLITFDDDDGEGEGEASGDESTDTSSGNHEDETENSEEKA